MYNLIVAVGRVGKDPTMRYTPDGKPVTTFSLAAASGKNTIWLNVTVWDKLAETCNNYLKKGEKALIEGRLTADPNTGGPRIWKKQDGSSGASFEVTASTVRFLSDRKTADDGDVASDEDDNVPF